MVHEILKNFNDLYISVVITTFYDRRLSEIVSTSRDLDDCEIFQTIIEISSDVEELQLR